jgi:hypothetical protein
MCSAANVVLSPLARRFRRLMREHGLPLPRTNLDLEQQRHGEQRHGRAA